MSVDGQGGIDELLSKLSILASISLLPTQTLGESKGSTPNLPTRTDIVAEVCVVPGDNVAWGIVVANVDCPFGTSDRPGALPDNLGEK